MVNGMAKTAKINITLQQEQLDEIRALVAASEAASVSGFVQHAVNIAIHDAAGWRELLQDAMDQTGGPMTRKERQWADGLLAVGPRKKGPGKGRAA